MLGNNPAVLADDDAIRIGVNFNWPPDRARSYRVFVIIEAHQAGLGDRRWHRVEAVEAARIGNELRPLGLEHLPNCQLGQFRMMMRFRVGDAFIEQPGVHLVIGLEPQPWCKEALTHKPDLVLDLTLLPTRGRGAGDRLHQIMAAHLQETPIVEPVLADEDRLHRGLHVVVDAASTRPLEQREGAVVSIEHHLLRLARITPDTRHYELPSSMGGESSEAWRAVLEDLIKRGLQRPQFLIVDGAAGLEKAIAAVWEGAPVQRCTVHKHRNLLAHAPE